VGGSAAGASGQRQHGDQEARRHQTLERTRGPHSSAGWLTSGPASAETPTRPSIR